MRKVANWRPTAPCSSAGRRATGAGDNYDAFRVTGDK